VKRVRYGHLYRWTPPGAVEHFLTIQNDDKSALTTGPCLAVSGDQPLSEDLLKYTPKNGRAELPVTSAVNVATESGETESNRQLKAIGLPNGNTLDLVSLAGELKVRNFEPRPVEVVIEAPVRGRPTSASDGGAMSTDPDKLVLRERAGTVRWRLTLGSGETKVLKYEYERYVPSN
jgi:hypothetical protein